MVNMDSTFNITIRQNTPTINLKSLLPNYDRSLIDDIEPTIILQVGAGGTGSYVVPSIMRYIGSLPEIIRDRIFYSIVDGDTFEAKNLDRQNCMEEDLGKNKAVAMIDAYAEYYGIKNSNVKAVTKYITKVSDLYEAIYFDSDIVGRKIKRIIDNEYNNHGRVATNRGSENPVRPHVIVIDAVDKTTPRNLIYQWMNCHYSDKYSDSISDIYLISSGNGKFSGQVGFGRYTYPAFRNCGLSGESAKDVLKSELEVGIRNVSFILEDEEAWSHVTTNALKDIRRNAIDHMYRSIPRVGRNTLYMVSNNYGYSTTIKNIVTSGNEIVSDIRSIDLEEVNRCIITPLRAISSLVSTKLPYDRIPELIDVSIDEEEEQLSCADRALQNVQSIQANTTASNIVCNYVLNILSSMYPMDSSKNGGIKFHTVAFDAKENSYSSSNFTLGDIIE